MKKYIIAEYLNDKTYYYTSYAFLDDDFLQNIESADHFNSIEEAEEVQAKLPEGIYKIEPIYVNKES